MVEPFWQNKQVKHRRRKAVKKKLLCWPSTFPVCDHGWCSQPINKTCKPQQYRPHDHVLVYLLLYERATHTSTMNASCIIQVLSYEVHSKQKGMYFVLGSMILRSIIYWREEAASAKELALLFLNIRFFILTRIILRLCFRWCYLLHGVPQFLVNLVLLHIIRLSALLGAAWNTRARFAVWYVMSVSCKSCDYGPNAFARGLFGYFGITLVFGVALFVKAGILVRI